MFNNIFIQYDTRKKSIIKLILITNAIILLCVLTTYLITREAMYIWVYALALVLQTIYLYHNREVLIFEHRFLKFYETMLHERKRDGDIDTFKNPKIFIQHSDETYKIKFNELGYFLYEDYEKIARRVERFCQAEFINMYKERNYQVLQFEGYRSRIIFDEDIDYDNIPESDGLLELDSKLIWDYEKQPHAIISGSTGSGKSYLLNYMMTELLRNGCIVWQFDPKYEYDVMKNMVHVFNDIDDIMNNLRVANEELETRKMYQSADRTPMFLVFEELAALKAIMTNEQRKEFEKIFNNILFTGRATNINIIVVSQSVSAKLLGDSEIRSQFHCKIHLGALSREKSEMLFGMSRNRVPERDNVMGSGYIELNERVYSYIAPTMDD